MSLALQHAERALGRCGLQEPLITGEELLKVLLDAEDALRGYLYDYTSVKDPVTYDYSLAILHKAVEHGLRSY